MNRVTFALVYDRARFASPLPMMPLFVTRCWLIRQSRGKLTVKRCKQAIFIAFAEVCCSPETEMMCLRFGFVRDRAGHYGVFTISLVKVSDRGAWVQRHR